MTLEAFRNRVLLNLLPEYCDDSSRGWGSDGFKPDWSKISELDANDFLRALDANLVEHVGRGQYVAPRSACKEQFFWEGEKRITPRPIYLWLEPIITVAALARLHFEYGWPRELIGMQSQDYAFDVTTFHPSDMVNEHVACEVKKSASELDRLVETMQQLAADDARFEAAVPQARINAFRKLQALRARKSPVFWALGPDAASFVFRVSYAEGGLVTFSPASNDELLFVALRDHPARA